MTPEELVAALEAEVAAKQAELAAAQEAIAAAQQAAAAVQAELEAKQVELAAAVQAATIPTPLNGNINALLPWMMVGGSVPYCVADTSFALIRKDNQVVYTAPNSAGSLPELIEGCFGSGVYNATITGTTITITGAAGTGPINIASIGVKHHGSSTATFINVG
jgi:hypothetical protein